MLKRNKKMITAILGIFLGIIANGFSSDSVYAASNRLWGQDRYETAVAISKEGWTNSDYVVLASGEGYADALCAAPLAKKYNAPILLTGSNELNNNTKDEIKRLGAKHVFIVGKYASVSQEAENNLSSVVSDITRLGGNDRYETSVIVAKALGTVDSVAVTSGYGFADALSIAPIAAEKNMPILLTGKDGLPQVVQDYINTNKASINNSYVIGGQGVISDSTAQQLSKSTVRLSGQDRFETNMKVMQYFAKDLKFDTLYVVQADGPTGNEFADALSGTALAVRTTSPVILTYKSIPSVTEDFIKSNVNSKTNIVALGGTAAVPDTIVSTIETYANPSNVQPPTVPQIPAAGGGAIVSSNGTDGDVQLIFSNGSVSPFNIASQSAIDISNNFNNNNLTKIKIYSASPRSLVLSINGVGVSENVGTGWTELNVPSDFGMADSGDPGIDQNAFDIISKDGKFNLTIRSGSDSKTVVVTYR